MTECLFWGWSMRSLFAFFLFVVALPHHRAAAVEATRYVAEHPAARPRFRTISSGLPAASRSNTLTAEVDPTATWQFGWFTYGDEASRSVIVGQRNGVDVFVDADRDLKFVPQELCTRKNDVWPVVLGAEFLDSGNLYDHHQQSVLIRRDSDGEFEVATAGVLEGVATVDGASLRLLRLDRNSNGLWFDDQDRVLIDFNGDDQLDPIAERLACQPICRVAGKRFAMQSDQFGRHLKLVALDSTGSIVPSVTLQPNTSLTQVTARLVSKNGIRVPIRAVSQPIECPVGEYRIEQVDILLVRKEKSYFFRFACTAAGDHSIKVSRDKATKFELIGDLRLENRITTQKNSDGQTLTVTPFMNSSTGLFLMGCRVGDESITSENRLQIELRHEGKLLDRTSTGFS